MAIVRLPRALLKKLHTTPEGKGTPLPFGVPANHLASFFFPLPMSGDPRSLRCEHLRDPHSLLTVTFWLLDNVSSTGGEYHSYLFVFVSYHVTIVISFLVQWSISSLVHFKNSLENLMKGHAKPIIPLIRFLPYSLVLSSLFSWDTIF